MLQTSEVEADGMGALRLFERGKRFSGCIAGEHSRTIYRSDGQNQSDRRTIVGLLTRGMMSAGSVVSLYASSSL